MKKKNNQGITLVALVVTIVVLLILAGITLVYVFGDNGVFKLAQEAKNKTEEAIDNEKGYMNQIGNRANEYLNGIGNGGTTKPPEEVPIENIKSDWATIEKIAQEIAKDDSITSDSEEVKVTVDGKTYTIKPGDLFEVKYNEEVRRVRVLGFKHDDLVNTGVYGGSYTKASISFEFLDFVTGTTYIQMNTSNTNSGGWANAKLRTDLNGSGSSIGGLGANLNNKAYIKQVKKKYIPTYNVASTNTCNDFLWLLACSEIVEKGYQSGYYGYAITSEGNQYQYYKGVTDEWNAASTGRTKYNTSGSSYWWWLRSPSCNYASAFCGIGTFGGYTNAGADAGVSGGVAPGFCI